MSSAIFFHRQFNTEINENLKLNLSNITLLRSPVLGIFTSSMIFLCNLILCMSIMFSIGETLIKTHEFLVKAHYPKYFF